MRKETITAIENIGTETHTINLSFILHRDDIQLINTVKKAVVAYINSGYGFQEYERNCYCFNWGDVSSIPNSFFRKFGIEKTEDGAASIPVDYNEQLFSSLNLSFSDEQWKQLKKELFMEGTKAIEEFLDMDIDENMEKDSIENLLDQISNEMTADEKLRAFSEYCLKELEEDNTTSVEKNSHAINLICNVGDIIWDIADGYLEPCKVTAFSYGECEGYIEHPVAFNEIVFYYIKPRSGITGSFATSEIGNTLLLTKEEAERKLEENLKEKKMKDLIITYENGDEKILKKEYDHIYDFTEEIESDKGGIPMLDYKNVTAVFFEKTSKHFDTIDDLYKHCVSIMK